MIHAGSILLGFAGSAQPTVHDLPPTVIPAQAGIQSGKHFNWMQNALDPRLRGDDGDRERGECS
ncbi:hypothetical protein QQM79_19440 [Marinobacteraceae bacterium S3BR75-40.1]